MGLSIDVLNQNCKSYPVAFSPERNAESMKAFAFPVIKRQPAEKCHDIAPWLQKGSRAPVIDMGEDKEIIKKKDHLTQEQLEFYSTPEGIAKLNKQGIKIAIDRRIQLFFQQAILCYGMSSLTFSAKGADEQIGTAPAITFSSENDSITHEREAAHSSTIPTLIATAKDGSTPNGFVYLKGGSSHSQHNATIGMDECVNGADELIDGKADKGLRGKAVEILNRVAEGLDPTKAVEEFIPAFREQVVSISNKLKAEDARKSILEAYLKRIDKVQAASTQREFYDRMIGVIIHSEDPREALLRKNIYKKRYDIIRLEEMIESRIGKQIDDAKRRMGKSDRSFIEYLLLKEFSETKERQILEKLFAKTAAIFEETYGEKQDGTSWINNKQKSALKAFNTRINNLQAKYKTIIDNLKRDLRVDFRELICAKYTYRAGVFKDIRLNVNNWTQKKFCDKYFEKAGYTISKSWVSRVEELSRINSKRNYVTPLNQRRRYLSIQEIRNCADTFGVDPGVFFPSLFTS